MIRMQDPLRSFRVTLVCVWMVLCVAGFTYAQLQNIPASVALPLVAAFLFEASFYLVPGFAGLRERLERRWTERTLALWLSCTAVMPYCAYSLPTGTFHWTSLAALAALALAVSFWYLLLPRIPVADFAFVSLMAVVVLARVFPIIYASPAPGVGLEILGHLMWIRLGVMVMLSLRRVEKIGFGFLPHRREWAVGIRHYLYFLPVGAPLALATGLMRFEPVQTEWWKVAPLAVGTFLGMLWVVALSEEFFFRGLLQQWLSRWLASERAGLVAASVLFGLVHLSFRSFPNWKFAAVAVVAGLFYGRAYAQTAGIRAAMVTHALVNTTWRLLLA